MSSVGFSANGRDNELEKLRDACSSINDILRNIASAQNSLEVLNIGTAKDYLKVALWHAGQAKKVITALGQAKNQKASRVGQIFDAQTAKQMTKTTQIEWSFSLARGS